MFKSLIARFSSSSVKASRPGLIEFFQEGQALPLYDADKKEPFGKPIQLVNYN